jgi:hypothetical protein
MKQDPPRLLDSLSGSDPVKIALDAARGDGPSADQLTRLAGKLPLGLPTGGGGGGGKLVIKGAIHGASVSAPIATGAPILSGALLGAVLGIAVVGGAWVASPRAPEDASPSAVTSASSTALPSPISRPAVTAEVTSRPENRATETPKAPQSALPNAPQPPPTAESANTPVESAPSIASPPVENESEAAMLRRAQDALGASPSKALEITSQHMARFPSGNLAQEREVLAIQALLALGRAGEARARAAQFATRYPGSAHLRRIEVLFSSDSDHKKSAGSPFTP